MLRSRRSRSLALALGALVVIVVTSIVVFRGTPASAASSTLSILSGRTTEVAKGTAAYRAAADGETLVGDDQVRTAADDHALITFFDASTLALEPNTHVRVEEAAPNGSTTSIRLEQTIGRTWSSVQHLTNPSSRYEIKTPTAVATVRGTGLDVIVRPDGATQVSVTDGAAVVTAQGRSVTVSGGETTSVAPGQPPAPVTPIPAPPSTLRFGMHSPAYLAVVDPEGRSCGIVLPGPTVIRQIPSCQATPPGVEPQLIDVPNPSGGNYQMVIAPKDSGGPFTVTATGVSGNDVVFNYATPGEAKPGQILGSTMPVQAGANGGITSPGISNIEVIATIPVKAVLPSPSPSAPAAQGSTSGPSGPSGPAPTPNAQSFPPLPRIGFSIGPVITPAPAVVSASTPPGSTSPTPAPSTPPSAAPSASASVPPSLAPTGSPLPTALPSVAPTLPPASTPPLPTLPLPTATLTALPTPAVSPIATPSLTPSPAPTVTIRPTPVPLPLNEPPVVSVTPPPSSTATPAPTPTPSTGPAVPGAGTGVATSQGSPDCGGQPICGPDGFGYVMRDDRASAGPEAYWLDLANASTATRIADLDHRDDDFTGLTIPFRFPFYGRSFDRVFPGINGLLGLGDGSGDWSNSALPDGPSSSSSERGGFVMPFWEDLSTECPTISDCGIWYQSGAFTSGANTIQYAAFEWVTAVCCATNDEYRFEVVLYSDGRVDMNYRLYGGVTNAGPTIGIVDRFNANYLEYLYDANYGSLNGRTIRIYPSGVSDNTRPAAPAVLPLPIGQPAAPASVTASDVPSDTGNAIDLSWSASTSSGVNAYRIYSVRTGAGGTPYTLIASVASNVTTYQVTGLSDTSEHSFFVRAWNGTSESFNSPLATAAGVTNATSITINTTALNPLTATVGIPYETGAYVYTTGLQAPQTWSVDSGQLPPGIFLRSPGGSSYVEVRGVPTDPGTYNFTLRVTDAAGHTATQAYTLPVNGAFSLTHSTITASAAEVPADGTSAISVTVTLRDSSNAPVAGRSVSLRYYPGASSVLVSPASSVTTNASGVATFTLRSTASNQFVVGAIVDGSTCSATNRSCLTTGTPISFATAVTQLAVTGPRTSFGVVRNVGTGQTFNASVDLRASSGYRVTSASGNVTLSLNGGASGATLSGATTAPIVNGVAYFTGLSISPAGTGYWLNAFYNSVTAASPTFDVANDSAPPAAPVISSPLNGAVVTAGSIALSGTAEAGSTLTLKAVDMDVTTTVAVSAGGTWTYTWLNVAPAGKPVTFVAYARDASGNISTASRPVTVYTAGVTLRDAESTQIGQASPGQSVSIAGVGFPEGAPVTVTIGSTPVTIPATTVSATRAFSVSITVPADAASGLGLTVTAGGVSAVQGNFVRASSLSVASGGRGGDTIGFSGSGWPVGSTVTLQWESSPLSTLAPVTVSALGNMSGSFIVPATPAGSYTITATGGTRSVVVSFAVSVYATLSTTSGTYGAAITASGSGYPANTAVSVKWDADATNLVSAVTTDANGSFSGAAFTRPATNTYYGTNHAVHVAAGASTYDVAFSANETIQLNDSFSLGSNVPGYANEQQNISASGFSGAGSASVYVCSGATTATTNTSPCNTPVAQYLMTLAAGSGSVNAVLPNLAAGAYTVFVLDPNNAGNSVRTNLTIRTERISVSPTTASDGISQTITVTGTGFSSGEVVTLDLCAQSLGSCTGLATTPATVTADTGGSFSATFALPSLGNTSVEIRQVRALGSSHRAAAGLTVQPVGF